MDDSDGAPNEGPDWSRGLLLGARNKWSEATRIGRLRSPGREWPAGAWAVIGAERSERDWN